MESKNIILKISGLFVFAILNFACSSKVNTIADRNAIAEVSGKMIILLNARSYDQWLSYLADNATLLPSNTPPVTGKNNIRKLLAETMKDPDLSIVHHPLKIEVSRSGDMAYVRYMFDVKIARDTTAISQFKDLSIFVKGNDGHWKLLYDMWSPNGISPKLGERKKGRI
jgi:ketosteroid isomerase-like protein